MRHPERAGRPGAGHAARQAAAAIRAGSVNEEPDESDTMA
jgi:hypothetical protein